MAATMPSSFFKASSNGSLALAGLFCPALFDGFGTTTRLKQKNGGVQF
jgi:hypothetical protein